MESVNRLLDTTVEELEKILTTRTVVGDPIEVGGHTIIPLVSVGFGFGGGGGTGSGGGKAEGEGTGGGTGGGGGVKPIGVIVIDDDGVRVEPVKGSAAAVVEKLGTSMSELVDRALEKRGGSEAGDAGNDGE